MTNKYEWNSAVQESDEGFEHYICNVDDGVALSLHKSSFNNEYMGHIYSEYGNFNQGFIHSELSKAKQLIQKQWEEIEKVGGKNKLKEIADNLSNYSNKKKQVVNNESELIVCAAIKFYNICDPDIEMIIPSIRHYDPLCNNILDNMEYDEWEEFEQGFLTNKGHFVDRKEALAIAKANNQIRYSIGYEPDELYSEMLY